MAQILMPNTLWYTGLYKAFDVNEDGHIDFKEMVCGISACCRGPTAERQKCLSPLSNPAAMSPWRQSVCLFDGCHLHVPVCFKVFDLDHDGYLTKNELIGAIEASFTVLEQNENSEVSIFYFIYIALLQGGRNSRNAPQCLAPQAMILNNIA